jgi:LAO/AO transport system kinase
VDDLLEKFWAGEFRALARLISNLENEMGDRNELMCQLYPRTGRAYILGVTGSPGTGKSSLVDCLTTSLRKRSQKVAIVAVDPTSPFTGGALLGDRIRMQEHAVDQGVFIRSMATRGSLGGLAHTTKEVIKAIDAFGFEWIIVETVGVGQAELDIMNVADTTVVVLTPGAGDAIQTIKAGIMEIADVFAVNKVICRGQIK